jgi:hypothetical protein
MARQAVQAIVSTSIGTNGPSMRPLSLLRAGSFDRLNKCRNLKMVECAQAFLNQLSVHPANDSRQASLMGRSTPILPPATRCFC